MKNLYKLIAIFFTGIGIMSGQGIGKALDFDGNDDYVTVASSATPVVGSWTISAWVQPKHATKNMHIFDSRSPSECGFDMQILNGNTIHCDIGNGTSWKTVSADATYNYTPGVWFHVALSVDYFGYYIYVNGKIIASGPLDYTENNVLIDTNHQLQIGRNPNYSTYYRGAIDEVRINRTSGHPSEALMTAEMNSPVYGIPSIVLSYSFNNAATTANGNNPGQTTVVNEANSTRYGTMNAFYLQSDIGNWTTDRDYYSVLVNGTTFYQNLKSAFDAINAGTHTGNVTIQIIRDTNEPDTAQLNGSGTGSASYSSITIKPVGGVQRTINVGGNGIFLSNASNVTIDGLNTDGNSLKIVNANAGFSTIWIHNNANYNTISKCTVLGSGAAGIIKFTNAGSHTINNTITECTIGPFDANIPNYGIYWESNSVYRIRGLNITSNNIYDYGIAGVYGQDGTVNAAINGNKLFQTTPKTISGGHYGIFIGNAYADNQLSTINNNTIGYSSATGAGSYTLTGTGDFKPIAVLNSEATVGTTTIANNTIAGITMSGNFSGEGLAAPFTAIVDYIGGCTIHHNTIGSLSGSSSINFNSTSTSAMEFYGIHKANLGNFDISYNDISGITAISNGQLRMSMIKLASEVSQDAVRYCVGNTVGGITPDAISNLSTTAGSDIVGIYTERSALVSDNTVRNITGKAPDANGRVTGIYAFTTNQYSSDVTVSRNKIYNLTNTSNTPGAINGVEGSSIQAFSVIKFEKNYIHSFNTTAAGAVMSGVKLTGRGNYDVFNNMVSLGINVPTATTIRGVYGPGLNTSTTEVTITNNSFYIGGTQTAGTASSEVINISNINYRRFFNNILVNNRTNAGASGTHYCMNLSVLGTLMYMDRNIYFGNGAGFMVANLNGVNRTTFADYRSNLGPGYNEGGGFFSNPQYLDPANATAPDLHLSTTIPTYAEGNADNDTSYRPAEDIDNEVRSGATDIGADEGNFTAFATPAITNLSTSSGCVGSSLTITGNNFYQVTAVRIGTTNCSITGSTSNSVTVTVPSGASGAVAVDAFTGTGTGGTFTIYSAPVITSQPATPAAVCANYESATISVTAAGGSTYKWRRNGIQLTNTPPFSNVTTSTLTITNPDFSQNGSLYDVLITDAGNCGTVTSNQVTLTVKQRPTIGVSTPVTVCRNTSTTLTATGGVSYTWSPSTGLSATTGASVTATPTATTTYTVTGTNAGGCTNTNSVTVTVNQLPTIDVTPASASVCPGSSATLTASGGISYIWSPATGLNTTTGATVIARPSATTTYTVTGTDSNGCVNTRTVTVSIRTLPAIGVSPTSGSICNGESQTFTASGGVSYTWSPATGLNTTTGNTVIASPTSTTTYTLTGTDANGCVNTTTFTVTLKTPPTVNVSGGGAVCPGSGRTLTASGGSVSYSWSPATGLSAATGASVTASPTSTTTYTVTGTGSNGCTATNTVTVTVNTLPTVNISPSAASVCAGSSVILTANGASTYVWSPATGLNTTTGDTVICSTTTTRTYTVTGTDSNGCINTKTVVVTVNNKPTLNISPAAPTICPGNSVSLTANGATSYTWSPATGLNTTSGATVVASPASTTTYTVTGTDANGCTNTKTVTVTVDTNGSFSFNVASPVICFGNSQPISITGGGAGNSYSWSPSTGLNTTTGASVTASPTTTTTYTAQCTTSAGCTSTRQVTVTVNNPPTVSLNLASATICNGNSVTLIANGATTYSWSPSTGLDTTNGNTVIASPSNTTTYTVTGNSNGCSTTTTITVNVTPHTPATVPFNSATMCSSDAPVQLSVNDPEVGSETTFFTEDFENGGTGWSIDRGASSPTEADWLVEFYDTTTLAKSHIENVLETPVDVRIVSPVFSTVGYSDCKLTFQQYYAGTADVTAVAVEISTDAGAHWNVLYDYINDDIATFDYYDIDLANYSNTPNLQIRFRQVGKNGQNWYVDNVTIRGLPSQTTWSPTAGLYTDSAATAPYTGNGIRYVYAKPNTTTTYTATTPTASGCQPSVNSIAVHVNPSPTMTITGNTSVCQGSSTALHVNGTGAISYDWSPTTGLDTASGTDVVASPSATTTYTVTAVAANGCITTKEVTISVLPYTPATVNTNAVTSCVGAPAVALEVSDPLSTYTLINEDFEDTAPDWENAGWTFNYNGPTGGQAQSPYFTSANSYMATPSFNTTGMTSCVLTFDSFYGSWYSDWFVGVQVTVDNGANWSTLVNYTGNAPDNGHSRQNMTINLDAYTNQPDVKVRFFYGTNGGYVWNIDNVQIEGFASNTIWSPTTGLYTDAAAVIPYTGQKLDKVFAQPASTTVYTADTTVPNGCRTINTINVTVATPPTLSISGNTDSCIGQGTVLSATGADTYSWSPSIGLNTDTGSTVIADPSSTTTYTVTGTKDGCSSTQTITVTAHTPIAATVPYPSIAKCGATGPVALTVNDPDPPLMLIDQDFSGNPSDWTIITAPTAGAGWGYQNFGAGREAIAQRDSGDMDSQLISPTVNTMGLEALALDFDYDYFSGSGNYNIAAVEVSGDNGATWDQLANYEGSFVSGMHARFDLQAYVNRPAVTIRFNYVSATTQVWRLDNIKLGSKAKYSSWSPLSDLYTDASATTPYNGELLDTVYADPTATTVYTVTTTADSGCATTNTISVNVGAAPHITVSDDKTICEGGTGVTLTASGAVNYVWSPSTGLNTTTGDTVIANPLSTTTYTVTADNGGCTTIENITVTVNPYTLDVSPSSAVIANNDSVTLQASGALTYSWSPSTGLNTAFGETVVASPSSSTTYTVTGITASGCKFTKSVTVIVNQPTFTDNSLHFDGIDDYVNMPNSPVTVSANFTIEGWFKPEEATKRMHVFSTRGGGDQSFDLQITDGHIFHADLGTGGNWENTAADIDHGYAADTWMHIACVVTPEKYRLYVNGALVGEIDVNANILLLDGNHFLSLGNSQTESTFFKGNIDDVRIYNTVRSDAEIQSDMNSGVPGSGIVARYDFNVGTPGGNNAGLTALPAVNGGSDFDGTLHNFTLNGNSSNWVFGHSLPSYCNAVTVWNGAAWSNGAPDSNTAAIISGNFTSDGDLFACTLTVVNHADVLVNDHDDFNIQGVVTVVSGATLTIEDGSSLLQGLDDANSGDIIVKKQTQMVRQDYVYWSAPVVGQNLRAFSPQTLLNRFYTLNEAGNNFASINPAVNNFEPAKGFMIRAPNNFLNPPASPQLFIGTFEGVANNGPVDIPITVDNLGYNLIGNPYPSSLNADLFIAQNPGTIYFWTHRAQGSASGANYCSYNTLGGTAAITGGNAQNGSIASGQGFILQTSAAGNAHFENSMRTGNDAVFFRSDNGKHRIWLNLNSSVSPINQILVGYMDGATIGDDIAIDGKQIEAGTMISSTISGQNYVIQGRPLPFETADVVPLSFEATTAGTFSIAVDHVDGLFSGEQEIYLRDNLLGTIQSIKNTGYTFASDAGSFTNRFEILYQNAPLSADHSIDEENAIVVYKEQRILKVNSGKLLMHEVKIFDTRGRLIYTKNDINAQQVTLDDLRAEEQVILVQIISDDNRKFIKKVVY
ncbi:MAG: hypothetical protein CFE23_08165 [Flavobacterium sp. BFFFF1]|uniref:LamG-like jellyroll fold domain-containing protein n=1 Tax=Flavobacterium sp. BFFFF1 TaxID=2015557 RepID=UPI000BD108D9|nr:LamG-like jellyroll fold domain-containing protein [Flavobacterium sp. BFFFF1]OYU80687.1 MAG: hypothetical protein CFE23_08165 [Flavobacterium sp. BFFFF1]